MADIMSFFMSAEFGALASVIGKVADLFRRRQLIEAGENRARAKVSEEALEKINTANRARIDSRKSPIELRDKWARD